MEERLTSRNVADAVPKLLALVSQEHAAGRLSDGEYHLFRDHLFSGDLHAIRCVNQQLLSAASRAVAPEPQVARLAQQPRDPATNRSSFGSVVVLFVAMPPAQRGPPGSAAADLARQQLHESLRRAIKALQKSFGDRLASLTFESVAAPAPAPPARKGVRESAAVLPKMVLSRDGEWVYPQPPEARGQEARDGSEPSLQRRPERRQGDPVAAEEVAARAIAEFIVTYRVTTDSEGRTVGGGVDEDRELLGLTLARPELTGHEEQRLIKGFAGCLQ